MPNDFKHVETAQIKKITVHGKDSKPCKVAGTEICISFEYLENEIPVFHDVHVTELEAQHIMKKLQSQIQLNKNK